MSMSKRNIIWLLMAFFFIADLAAAAAADHSPANRVIEYFITIDHDKRSFV